MASVTSPPLLDETLHSINNAIVELYKAEGKDTSWANATDETIVEMVALADQGKIDLQKDLGWAVGDARNIHLSAISKTGTYDGYSWDEYADQDVQDNVLVLCQNGGIELENGNECNFVVGLKYVLNEPEQMSHVDSYYIGTWDQCELRKWCNGGFRSAIPSTISSIFKKMKVVTASAYDSTANTTSIDYFALFAEREVQGVRVWSNLAEYDALSQIEYFKSAPNKIKTRFGEENTPREWLIRSPINNNNQGILTTNVSGGVGGNAANVPYYVAPFGCI